MGGYLAARSDAEHYHAERAREETEVREKAQVEAKEVADVFRAYGLTAAELKPAVDALPEAARRVGGFHDARSVPTLS